MARYKHVPSWMRRDPTLYEESDDVSATKNDGIKWFASGKLTLGAVAAFALAAAGWGYSIKSTAADAAKEAKDANAGLAAFKVEQGKKDEEAKARAKEEDARWVRMEKAMTRVETLLEQQAKARP